MHPPGLHESLWLQLAAGPEELKHPAQLLLCLHERAACIMYLYTSERHLWNVTFIELSIDNHNNNNDNNNGNSRLLNS